MLGIACKISSIKLNEIAREKGLLMVPASNNVLRILPPLNVKKSEIDQALQIMNKVCSEL